MKSWDELAEAGRSAHEAGQLESAASFTKRAILSAEEWIGAGSREVARCRVRLGEILRELGKVEEAEPQFDQAVVALERYQGADAADLLRAREGLADCLLALGRHDEAVRAFDERLRLEESRHGADSWVVSTSLLRQAEAHLALRAELSAEVQLRRCLAIREASADADPAGLLRPRLHLAAVLARQGRSEQALELAPARLEELGYDGGEAVATSLRALARDRVACQDFAGARRFLEHVVESYQRSPAHDATARAHSLVELGFVYLRLEEHARALGPLRLALGHLEARPEVGAPAIAEVRHWLALALAARGSLPEAQALLQQAAEEVGRSLGTSHPRYFEVLQSLGSLFLGQGKLPWAERYLTHSFLGLDSALGLERAETFKVAQELGRCLSMQGKREQVRQLFQRLVHRLQQTHGPEHPMLGRYTQVYRLLDGSPRAA